MSSESNNKNIITAVACTSAALLMLGSAYLLYGKSYKKEEKKEVQILNLADVIDDIELLGAPKMRAATASS